MTVGTILIAGEREEKPEEGNENHDWIRSLISCMCFETVKKYTVRIVNWDSERIEFLFKRLKTEEKWNVCI